MILYSYGLIAGRHNRWNIFCSIIYALVEKLASGFLHFRNDDNRMVFSFCKIYHQYFFSANIVCGCCCCRDFFPPQLNMDRNNVIDSFAVNIEKWAISVFIDHRQKLQNFIERWKHKSSNSLYIKTKNHNSNNNKMS